MSDRALGDKGRTRSASQNVAASVPFATVATARDAQSPPVRREIVAERGGLNWRSRQCCFNGLPKPPDTARSLIRLLFWNELASLGSARPRARSTRRYGTDRSRRTMPAAGRRTTSDLLPRCRGHLALRGWVPRLRGDPRLSLLLPNRRAEARPCGHGVAGPPQEREPGPAVLHSLGEAAAS